MSTEILRGPEKCDNRQLRKVIQYYRILGGGYPKPDTGNLNSSLSRKREAIVALRIVPIFDHGIQSNMGNN
jgi:hypothetical protein